MAKGKKTGGRNIKKGQVLNPLGGKAHCPETKVLRSLSRTQLKEILRMVLTKNIDELQALAQEPSTPLFQAAAASAALKAYSTGDWEYLEGPLARILGKVKEEVHISGEVTARDKYQLMTDEELKRVLAQRAADRAGLLLE